MFKYCLPFLIILLSFQTSFAQNNNIVLEYISKHKSELGFSDEDVRNCIVKDHYVSKHNHVRHVYLQQMISGIPVEHTISNLNVSKSGELLSINNRFIALKNQTIPTSPSISSSQALDFVLQDINIPLSKRTALISQSNDAKQSVSYAPMEKALEDINIELNYIQNGKAGMKLAWKVIIEVHNPNFHIWEMYVDSATGEILEKNDLVIKCNFDHQHNGSCASTPYFIKDECQEEKASQNSFFAPDSYQAYPLRVESPNHGVRELLVNPADLTASPYGWHDDNGIAGAEYTHTRGNNVLAQDDINGNNGNGYSPSGGNSLDFVYTQDLNQDPSSNNPVENLNSSITNLFVWNNLMHDVWYNYGFDEESGNYQANNYGNGGQGNDYVLADCQDGSGDSNANFAPWVDGTNGRMQMYMWSSSAEVALEVNSPSGVAGNYSVQGAAFGAQNYDITGDLILMNDGSNNPTQGCQQVTGLLNGKIAVIDRGDCQYGEKALMAENDGAIAVIICNNQGGPEGMAAGNAGGNVTIPTVMIGQGDCATIRVQISNGVEVHMSSTSNGFAKDGSLDNGIISHEYGHGISTRITGGPNTSCLNNQEQGGEGWSDFFALVMTQELDHDRNTVRGIGTYATSAPINGNGIRTYPYTTDMSVNPHTYSDIGGESIPHGVGSVLCAMLWDLYWDLIDVYGFDQDIYNGTGGNNIAMQLVIDGLKLQPCSPGFIDVRESILMADEINNNGENYCLIWNTFARRGLGYGASQGSSDSSSDGTQSFNLPPDVLGLGITKSSDLTNAGAGETITYTLNIGNRCEEFTDINITDILPGGMTYVDGSASDGGTMDGGILTWPSIPLLEKGSNVIYTYQATVNSDVEYSIEEIFSDDMENGSANWTVSNTAGLSNWVIREVFANKVWFAEELEAGNGGSENQYLMMNPILLNGITELSFRHKYDTEVTWDGGKVEISLDNGITWQDLRDNFVENGYNNYIQNSPGNQAFSGDSNSYITSKVDLTEFCGEEVIIRFNFYYDAGVDGRGWDVDDVKLISSNALINLAEASSNGITSSASHCVRVAGGYIISNEDLSVNTEVEIYPNPSSANDIYLSIQSEKTIGDLGVRVFNAAGQLVYTEDKKISNDFISFKLMDKKLASGIYTVQLLGDEFTTVKKFMVL